MIYPEAIQFLYALGLFGSRFGLETTRTLAARAGNPQDQLRFIHVAGTNGKGSTCAILESIYRAAGLRVGLFTSPHLVSFRERIQVNRQWISKADFVRLVSLVRDDAEHRGMAQPHTSEPEGAEPLHDGTMVGAHIHPTLFEFVTVMALRYFAEQKCDLVIWETGLGGRLDATNIVTPLASVITNIQLDHQQWLGNTLKDIAFEKSGIIKPGLPVLTATSELEALAVIRQTARDLDAPLTCIGVEQASRIPDPASLSLLGDHQQLNAALALAVVTVLQPEIPVSAAQIRIGLGQVNWPGRFQIIRRPSGQQILLDGAHNLAGVETLALALRKHFPDANPTLILGMLADKDWRPMCARLATLATRILTVPIGSERSAKTSELAAVCRESQPLVTEECSSLTKAEQRTANDPFVIITGSLYLVGEALELLGQTPVGDARERRLNDWGGGKSHLS